MSEKAPNATQHERLMIVICRYRHLETIVEEVNDWCEEEGGQILLYGMSERARDGFLLTRWSGPIPVPLREKFVKLDRDIFDVVIYEERPLQE